MGRRGITLADIEAALAAPDLTNGPLGQGRQTLIRTNYDPEADVRHVGFGPEDARSDTAAEVAPGVYVELDPDGVPIGTEVTSARARAMQVASAA